MKNNGHIILDYSRLKEIAKAHRTLGHTITCTIGSWDMLHIGHLRYLMSAKKHGDILIVGVDSDRGMKIYKGPLRPIIPQKERLEMLSYQECVDYVTLVNDIDKKKGWKYGLVKAVKPDVFITTDSYTQEQMRALRLYSGKVLRLPRQARGTSTTKFVEKTVKDHLKLLLASMMKK